MTPSNLPDKLLVKFFTILNNKQTCTSVIKHSQQGSPKIIQKVQRYKLYFKKWKPRLNIFLKHNNLGYSPNCSRLKEYLSHEPKQ